MNCCKKNCNKCGLEHYLTKIGPLVFDKKPLHVFTIREGLEDFILAIESCSKLDYRIIHSQRGTKLMIYNIKNCEEVINNKTNNKFLKRQGYHLDLNGYLNYFEKELSKDKIPHIIGLFFGYPLKDVMGYMGYIDLEKTKVQGWCVFGNPSLSDRIYHSFIKAEDRMSKYLIENGIKGLSFV